MDLGCGTGSWLNRFQTKGYKNLRGMDADAEQFKLRNVEHNCLDLDAYNGEIFGEYDLITALEIIEHLANPGNLLELATKNLKPDGHILISTPNIQSLPARLRFLMKGRLSHFDDKSDLTHIYPVYDENFKRLLPRFGLKLVKTYFYPQKGYITFRKSIRFLSRLIQPLAKDRFPGDNIIFLIAKEG